MRGDGLYKRPGSPYWYYKVRDGGRWREISTRERIYTKAKVVRKDALADIENGVFAAGELARISFEKAMEKYLRTAALRLRKSTLKKERLFLARPVRLFGNLRCDQITDSQIFTLQESMKRDNCVNSYVNLVVDTTARVLRFAKVWQRIKANVRRLPERTPQIGRVLTPEEKARLFTVAGSNAAWLTAYAAAMIAVNTTLRGCELRALRWSDVELFERTVTVPGSKTDAGLRRIPLNDAAMVGFRLLRDRSIKLGGAEDNNYVFPACEHGHLDRSCPQRSWRSAWRSLTAAAGLEGLRFHDMRHQCITELAEKGHADQTIMAIAGHLSRRMLEHYSHIRLDAKRKALDSLAPINGVQPENEAISRPN